MLTLWASEHTDFSESTDEIAPLTEEEKKARLEELRQRLNEKKARQAAADKEIAKNNEVCCPFLCLPHLSLSSLYI